MSGFRSGLASPDPRAAACRGGSLRCPLLLARSCPQAVPLSRWPLGLTVSIPGLERALQQYTLEPSEKPFDLRSVPLATAPVAEQRTGEWRLRSFERPACPGVCRRAGALDQGDGVTLPPAGSRTRGRVRTSTPASVHPPSGGSRLQSLSNSSGVSAHCPVAGVVGHPVCLLLQKVPPARPPSSRRKWRPRGKRSSRVRSGALRGVRGPGRGLLSFGGRGVIALLGNQERSNHRQFLLLSAES